MALTPGTRLGVYEVTAQIGVGGMGEVYRARDTRLKRDVALKILPKSFASDPERLARFQREAEVLASLNHPHIAAIYGLEDADGVKALVMELVEGDDLSQRIARGAIPIDDALPIAKQIAEALEAAHEAGIIHRDLKPANIKLRVDGTVKVLDFGLAKAAEPVSVSSPSHSQSPTITTPAMTQLGVILGTAAYMAPEQARGAQVDKRADIWAFGCVLYEMLTGSRAFGGELISDVMASVLKSEPDYNALPRSIPPRLRALLARCLHKDPKRRWRDAGDVRIELEMVGEALPAAGEAAPPAPQSNMRRERALWASAIVVASVAAGLVASRLGVDRPTDAAPPAGSVVRFAVAPEPGTSIYSGGWIVPFAVSPDGRRLAFTATADDGRSRLWVRPLDSETAQVISGTEGALNPVWSPDSVWLGFQRRNVWHRVRIPGGTPETISTFRNYTSTASAAAWGDGIIAYMDTNGTLSRVSVQGGQPSELTRLDSEKEQSHGWPQFLKDGRHFLYKTVGNPSRVYVDSIDGGERALVLQGSTGRGIQYAPGYLFYVENKVLWAHPFDETTRQLSGNRRRLMGGLPESTAFSVSNTGVLAYWTQPLIQQAAQLQWMDRRGNRLELVNTPVVYDGFNLSRSGTRLATAQVGSDGVEIWVHDLTRGGGFPLKEDPLGRVPVWTPDEKQLVYLCAGALCLTDAVGGPGKAVRLTERSRNQLPQVWTATGDRLIYEDWSVENGIDLVVLDAKTKHVDRLGWNTTSNEFGGRLTSNDRWLAYVTDQSGQNDVWVAAFPSGQPRRRIAGGSHPSWKGDGSELFYISAEGNLTAVPVTTTDSSINLGTPTNLFRIPATIDVVAGSHNIYAPSRDGQRFIVAVKSDVTQVPPISVIVNWPGLLEGN